MLDRKRQKLKPPLVRLVPGIAIQTHLPAPDPFSRHPSLFVRLLTNSVQPPLPLRPSAVPEFCSASNPPNRPLIVFSQCEWLTVCVQWTDGGTQSKLLAACRFLQDHLYLCAHRWLELSALQPRVKMYAFLHSNAVVFGPVTLVSQNPWCWHIRH